MNQNKKTTNIAILGSTGSIGTQTLDVIRENPGRFNVSVLTAGRNVDLLAQQAREFRPERIVIADKGCYDALRQKLGDLDIRIDAGAEAISEAAASDPVDTVVTAMVGYSGLLPTIAAIKTGKRIALANKETLVVAGEIITRLLKDSASDIVPVDSEHSAIFQCLTGENRKYARKIILTASGGPFRTFSPRELETVTAKNALKHPNWDMGAKVTIDSASMMNKGFEMIEAKWLFDFEPKDIEIVVHPQSVVHSMVEFSDGSIKAQLGVPDMRIPISLALGYPDRLSTNRPALTMSQYANLTFEKPDYEKFPLLELAFEAIACGGNMPCILNAANEVANAAFLHDEIRFVDMPVLVSETMRSVQFRSDVTLNDLITTNTEAIDKAKEILRRIKL